MSTYLLLLVALVAGVMSTSKTALGNNQTLNTPDHNNDASSKPANSKRQTNKPQQRKRGQFVIAPIPTTSPAVGAGLVVVAGYIFKLKAEDAVSPPSVIGIVGAFTSNGSRGGGLGGRLYFDQNRYQTTFAFGKGRVNYDFFGVGRLPNRPAISVPIRQEGQFFFGEFLRNVGKQIFIGPRYQHRNLKANIDGAQVAGGFVVPEIDFHSTTVALGFHLQRDLRDTSFFPTKGSLLDLTGDFFDQSLGSRRQYQTYKLSFNQYRSLGEKSVVAYRGMACSANQSVPFYDLCLFGTNNDLRGYTGGEFQNRRMFAAQAELRRALKGRFGFVAFGGVGGVARRWNEFRSDQLLPAAGAGLRFTIEKKNHVNYRIDWAVGRAGHTLTIGVGEAF
jgi:hypothetical protein